MLYCITTNDMFNESNMKKKCNFELRELTGVLEMSFVLRHNLIVWVYSLSSNLNLHSVYLYREVKRQTVEDTTILTSEESHVELIFKTYNWLTCFPVMKSLN